MIAARNLTPLPAKFEGDYRFIGHRNCAICDERFSFEVVGLMEAAHGGLPDVCEKEECHKKYYVSVKKCWYCKNEYEYDQRKGMSVHFCSLACEELREAADKKQEEDQVRERIEERIKQALPKKYHALDTSKDITPFVGKSLYLFGTTGTGKSVLMASLLKHYLRHGREDKIADKEMGYIDFVRRKDFFDTKWVSMTEFIMYLQSLYRSEGADPFDEAKRVAEFEGYLFLDDLGAGKITEYVQQMIYFILNHREEACLKTVISSNLPLSKIDDVVGDRVSSRIAGMCEVIEISGEDMRLKK